MARTKESMYEQFFPHNWAAAEEEEEEEEEGQEDEICPRLHSHLPFPFPFLLRLLLGDLVALGGPGMGFAMFSLFNRE
jgi:hypothetical protein